MVVEIFGETPRPEPKYNVSRQGWLYQRDPYGHHKAWKRIVIMAVKAQMEIDPLGFVEKGDPMSLQTDFILLRPKSVKRQFPTVRPDLSNYYYSVENCLKGILYYDDDQIIGESASKRYTLDPYKQGVVITVKRFIIIENKLELDFNETPQGEQNG